MMVILLIAIIVFLIWYISGTKSTSSNPRYGGYEVRKEYNNSSINKRTEPKPVENKPKSISVIPTIIDASPKLKLSLVEGQYRVFQNYLLNGKQYTFGFPKSNCNDQRVWIGIGRRELERISYQEAMLRLNNQLIPQLGASNRNFNYNNDLPF